MMHAHLYDLVLKCDHLNLLFKNVMITILASRVMWLWLVEHWSAIGIELQSTG